MRDLRGREHVADEQRAGKRSKSRCAKTVPTSVALVPRAVRELAPQDGDARELADPAGQDRVAEQADSEGGEDVR